MYHGNSALSDAAKDALLTGSDSSSAVINSGSNGNQGSTHLRVVAPSARASNPNLNYTGGGYGIHIYTYIHTYIP